MSSKNNQLVNLLQSQVERLEKDLKAKAAECDELQKVKMELTEKALTAENKLKTAERRSTLSQEGASTETRVELAKATALVKSLTEGEGRHKQRIADLQRDLAREKEMRMEAEHQVESKQGTIEYVATELERVEEEKKDAIAQMELKQQSIELLSANVDTLTAVVEQHEKDAERHQAEWSKQKAMYEEKIKSKSGTLHEQEIAWETRNMEQERKLSEATSKIERLDEELAELRKTSEDMEATLRKRIADWEKLHEETKVHHAKEIDKLEAGVAAIQSGRGRLEQIKELHQLREKEGAEYEARIRDLEQALESLQAENESLAESNAQLAEVLENAGDDSLSHIGSALDAVDHEERVKQLEATTMRQLEVIEVMDTEKTRVEESLEKASLRIKDLEESETSLKESVANLKQDLESLSARHAALKKTMDASNEIHKKETDALKQSIDELKKSLATTTEERDKLRQDKVTLENSVATLKQEAEAAATQHKDTVEELNEEKASLRERLNEAIQERWSLEESIKAAAAKEKGNKGNAAEASEMVILTTERDDLKRKLQRLETEKDALITKREKELGATKEKLADATIQSNKLSLQYEKAQLQIKQLGEKLAAAEEKLKKPAAEPIAAPVSVGISVEDYDAAIDKMKARLAAQEEEHKEDAALSQKTIDELKDRLKQSEKECADLTAELSAGSGSNKPDSDLEERLKKSEQECAELKAKIESQPASGGSSEADQKKIAELTKLVADYKDAMDEMSAGKSVMAGNQTLRRRAGESSELRDALEFTRKELEDARQLQVQMRDQIEDMEKNEGESKRELEAELEELKSNFQIASEALEEFETTTIRLQEVEEQLEATEAELEEAKAWEVKFNEVTEREQQLNTKISQLEKQWEDNEPAAAARQEVEELKARVEKLSDELEAARIIAKSKAGSAAAPVPVSGDGSEAVAKLQAEVNTLKAQVAKRDEEISRQSQAMASLREAAESRVSHGAAAAVAVAEAPAASAPVVDEEPAGPLLLFSDDRAAFFSETVTKANPKLSSKEKDVVANPADKIVAAGGQVVYLPGEGDALRGCVALIKTGKEFEFSFCSAAEGEDALEVEAQLLKRAIQFATEQKAPGIFLYWPGSMSDAEKRFGSSGFKVGGVGPPPGFYTKWHKKL